MEFPYLSGAGLYRSEISEYRNLRQSPLRSVTEYEIELFCEDYRYGIVNDVRVPYRRGTVINERYAQDLSLRTLAEEVHLNPNYFHRIFTAACGMTPLAYLTEVRISHAKFLLRNTDRSVTEIAGQCGFSSYNYFCTVFRKAVGLSPSTFRDRANRIYDGVR